VAFQHYNRMLNHWQPKIRQEGTTLTFKPKKRLKTLTPGALAVAQFVAGHLNKDTNCYPISIKKMTTQLGLTKQTIGKALDQLVDWGVFERERESLDKAYTYRLRISCPEDCERPEHYTHSELATLPKKQASNLPKEQATILPKEQAKGGLNNRQLIEINKETNKEMNKQNPPCFNCFGDYEELTNGSREIIHSEDCPKLTNLKQSRAWDITKSENAQVWDSLDYREQQRANYLSLAKGKERKANQAEQDRIATQESRTKFQKIIARTLKENNLDSYDSQILEWLEIVYAQRQDIPDCLL
jgi:DNA-binding MarR family transcriptional regulator